MPGKGNLFSVPETNQITCSQQEGGYIINDSKSNILYSSVGKVVTTKTVIRVSKSKKGPAIATITQLPLEKKYRILDEFDNKLAELKILSRNEIQLSVSGTKYISQVLNRGKQFEFKQGNSIVMTIDKKLIALKDSYVIKFIDDFPVLIAGLTAIIIDDIYHLGTSN